MTLKSEVIPCIFGGYKIRIRKEDKKYLVHPTLEGKNGSRKIDSKFNPKDRLK